MKKVIFIAVIVSLFTYLGCDKAEQHEPTSVTPTETSDGITWNPNEDTNGVITTRDHCGGLTECHVTVTTDADVTLTVCGDLPAYSTACPYTSCNTGETSFQAAWVANTPKVFCATYTNGGQVCIRNEGGTAVGVRINFGTSTPISVSIGYGVVHCFHTNSNCETFDDC